MKLKIKKTLLKRKVNDKTVAGYYGRVVSNGKVAFDEIARASTKNTTLHPSEAELAAKMLLEGVCEQLKQGMIVEMGPMGTLYPAVNSPWKEDADELNLSEMTPKVNYKSSDDIAGAIRSASLAWVNGEADEEEDAPDAGDTTTTVTDGTGTTGDGEGDAGFQN